MDNKTYLKNAMRTDLKDQYENIRIRLDNKQSARLVHALLGIGGESGELQDQLKRHLVYGKDLDIVNLKEELGDLMWYCALALDEIGSSFDEVMAMNIAKLRARFPGGFTEEKAVNRDIEAERKVMEEKVEDPMLEQAVKQYERQQDPDNPFNYEYPTE